MKQLLDNALKYSSCEAAVEIEMQEESGILTVDITDHGEGIAVEEQTRIFERFFRSPSIKNQIPGSGLGLSIAHRIVQAHGGELTVSSQPGQTTFRITLPVLKQVIA
jgi:signal transduction histidine kinase